MKRIISWNVNGIRAAEKKGLFDYLESESPDFLCLQETKAQPDQLGPEFLERDGYHPFFASAKRKGYSGTAIYAKSEPEAVRMLDAADYDDEGRAIALEYGSFVLVSAYFPNSQAEGKRLDYKIGFCDTMLTFADSIVESGKEVIICGDYNIAHKPIDLARPKQNENNPGYLPEEREWMSKFLDAGYVDTFRLFSQEEGQYTWWSYRMNAREKNIGWRLDYHCVNERARDRVVSSTISAEVMGSDHCPVVLEFDEG